jgi:hypothetical protein
MRWLILPCLIVLSACESSDGEQAVGGVTQSEAAALNDAAAMLDESEAEGNIAASDE